MALSLLCLQERAIGKISTLLLRLIRIVLFILLSAYGYDANDRDNNDHNQYYFHNLYFLTLNNFN